MKLENKSKKICKVLIIIICVLSAVFLFFGNSIEMTHPIIQLAFVLLFAVPLLILLLFVVFNKKFKAPIRFLAGFHVVLIVIGIVGASIAEFSEYLFLNQ